LVIGASPKVAPQVIELPWEEARAGGGGGAWGWWVFLVLILAGLGFGAAYAYHHPENHYQELREAFLTKNRAVLKKNVDFGGIEARLMSEGLAELSNQGLRNPENVEELRDFLGERISVEGMLDVAGLPQESRPEFPHLNKIWGAFPGGDFVKWSYRGLGETEFLLEDGTVLFFERVGPLRWRLFRIDFPSTEGSGNFGS
jgi:hypothetical protein